MTLSVLPWLGGALVAVAAGFLATVLPRRRERDRGRRVAWSSARAAIHDAAVSRDAATTPVPEADRLLARAELLAAARDGGADAAREATAHARRADELWRAGR
ncbi:MULTISPECIES: DUF6403 family protein [unclassified Micromonospora]|uniref:DUF6403 family protein n=1 Tax=unclassified Micromonospora TaxID=2617518 RepID=UPI0022C76F19|nr:DUF6403 family protein [Micromonospora sp. AKA38]GHJ13685.1 hypothetical protein TPA0908_16800 [Micromonospora sp. AKA38]